MQAATPPIGIFDSGVGGLTVLAALRQRLPQLPLIYLGDTARVPYGTKSPAVVQRYALKAGHFLRAQGAKTLVIACNTASAYGLDALAAELEMPVLGVVEPGAELAARHSGNLCVGVLGTEGTIASGSYQRALSRLLPGARISAAACPLFVPLAEEGMADHPATHLLAAEYLAPLQAAGVDTLVLGCTHYPLLRPAITRVMGDSVHIVDSASAVAEAVAAALPPRDRDVARGAAAVKLFATDAPERFARVGRAFLGEAVDAVTVVDV